MRAPLKYTVFAVLLGRIKPEEEAYAPEYSCIAPLRLLAQKWLNPELWNRVNLLMDHDQERRRETKFWAMFQVSVQFDTTTLMHVGRVKSTFPIRDAFCSGCVGHMMM